MDFHGIIDENPLIIAEGSVIERIRRETRYRLDDDIANARMIYDDGGAAILSSIYREYIEAAKRYDLPILILTPTWRAGRDRLERAGLAETDVNGDCFEFLARIRDGYGAYAERILIGGLTGCRGDAYDPATALGADAAREHHSYQIERLAGAGVDLLFASTMPALSEAAGMAAAMAVSGLPNLVSFIIRANGNLLDGIPLREAIEAIDAGVSPAPAYYMVNCIHPENVRSALEAISEDDAAGAPAAVGATPRAAKPIGNRLIGLQGNASRMSPEELDGRAELDADPPDRWARAMLTLHTDYGMSILGGCCGTDNRHIARLAELYAGSRGRDSGPGTQAPVDLPIDGTLDLHAFRAGEVKDLVSEYLSACRERGIFEVRIIHGKGTGALRETVHSILRRSPLVERFRLAGEDGGGWGATIVTLKRETESMR